MANSSNKLQLLAKQAQLNTGGDLSTLLNDVRLIIDYVEKLQTVDTHGVEPLFNTSQQHQRLRADESIAQSYQSALADIAPLFEQNVYLVPNVIDKKSS